MVAYCLVACGRAIGAWWGYWGRLMIVHLFSPCHVSLVSMYVHLLLTGHPIWHCFLLILYVTWHWSSSWAYSSILCTTSCLFFLNSCHLVFLVHLSHIILLPIQKHHPSLNCYALFSSPSPSYLFFKVGCKRQLSQPTKEFYQIWLGHDSTQYIWD